MSDLTTGEVATCAAGLLAELLPGVHYVEAIAQVPHSIGVWCVDTDEPQHGNAIGLLVWQDSAGPDERPQLFRLTVQVEEITPEAILPNRSQSTKETHA